MIVLIAHLTHVLLLRCVLLAHCEVTTFLLLMVLFLHLRGLAHSHLTRTSRHSGKISLAWWSLAEGFLRITILLLGFDIGDGGYMFEVLYVHRLQLIANDVLDTILDLLTILLGFLALRFPMLWEGRFLFISRESLWAQALLHDIVHDHIWGGPAYVRQPIKCFLKCFDLLPQPAAVFLRFLLALMLVLLLFYNWIVVVVWEILHRATPVVLFHVVADLAICRCCSLGLLKRHGRGGAIEQGMVYSEWLQMCRSWLGFHYRVALVLWIVEIPSSHTLHRLMIVVDVTLLLLFHFPFEY
jgi:hypothetical protein